MSELVLTKKNTTVPPRKWILQGLGLRLESPEITAAYKFPFLLQLVLYEVIGMYRILTGFFAWIFPNDKVSTILIMIGLEKRG